MNPVHALRELMSEISEDQYCAGWMDSLEFALWKFIQGEIVDREYGMGKIKASTLKRLKKLAEKAGGWWTYFLNDEYSRPRSPDYSGPAFVPLVDWIEFYKKMEGGK
jgi:hypothetical protein